MVSMKRLTLAIAVAVIVLASVIVFLVRKTNRMERAMKPSVHLIAASAC